MSEIDLDPSIIGVAVNLGHAIRNIYCTRNVFH